MRGRQHKSKGEDKAHQGYREKNQKKFYGEEDASAESQEKNKYLLNRQIGVGEG